MAQAGIEAEIVALEDHGVLDFAEEPGGGLWIGTVGSGLERIDRETGRRERHGPGRMGARPAPLRHAQGPG